MTRALPALLLAGCLQGGVLELDGTWVATVERGCTQALTFGPGDAFASTLACPSGDTDEWRGVYTVDGDVLRIVDAAGETDLSRLPTQGTAPTTPPAWSARSPNPW